MQAPADLGAEADVSAASLAQVLGEEQIDAAAAAKILALFASRAGAPAPHVRPAQAAGPPSTPAAAEVDVGAQASAGGSAEHAAAAASASQRAEEQEQKRPRKAVPTVSAALCAA